MDDIKKIVAGSIVTILIGGAAYTLNQADIVKNFATDSGLTQEQAEQFVNSITEDQLGTWTEIGAELISTGQEVLADFKEIDCVTYMYEWETPTVSCIDFKEYVEKLASDWILLGQAYQKLDMEGASRDDINAAISLIDRVVAHYDSKFMPVYIPDENVLSEIKQTDLYNKALLKTLLESDQIK